MTSWLLVGFWLVVGIVVVISYLANLFTSARQRRNDGDRPREIGKPVTNVVTASTGSVIGGAKVLIALNAAAVRRTSSELPGTPLRTIATALSVSETGSRSDFEFRPDGLLMISSELSLNLLTTYVYKDRSGNVIVTDQSMHDVTDYEFLGHVQESE